MYHNLLRIHLKVHLPPFNSYPCAQPIFSSVHKFKTNHTFAYDRVKNEIAIFLDQTVNFDNNALFQTQLH